jgi:hypothetical protein
MLHNRYVSVFGRQLALLMSPLNNPPVSFDVVVVGSGGGPDETNLSASVYFYH